MRLFRIYRDDNADGGGGDVAPSGSGPAVDMVNGSGPIVDTPASNDNSSAPSTDLSPTGDNSPTGDASNATGDSGGAAPTNDYVLTKMPQRDTPEYNEAFNKLNFEDQLKLEQEINSMYNGTDEELAKLMNPGENTDPQTEVNATDSNKPTEKSGDETTPNSNEPQDNPEFKTITKDVFDKLPDDVKTTISAMNKELEAAQPYMDPEFQKGFDAVNTDPVIQNRLKELKEGNAGINEYIKDAYDPNSHVSKDLIENLDFSTEAKKKESLQSISNMLHDAANEGHKIATDNNNLNRSAYETKINTKLEVEKQISAMVSKNPSMQSDLAYEHADHPLSTFFTWVGESGMKGEQLSKYGVEHVFQMYQSQTGNMQKIIDKQVVATKKKVFLDMESLDNNARNMSRTTQTNTDSTHGQMYKGIDMERYANDRAYASRMYDTADWPTQQKLESFRYSGKIE